MRLRSALWSVAVIGTAVLGLGAAPAWAQSTTGGSAGFDNPSTAPLPSVTPPPAPSAATPDLPATTPPATSEGETNAKADSDGSTTDPADGSEAPVIVQPEGTTNVIVTPAPPAPVQPVAPATTTVVTTPPDEPTEIPHGMYRPRMGAGLLLGGGFYGFSRDQARGGTDNGGYWNVRGVLGTRQILGVEAAYVGSAQPINVLGLSNNASLIGNGAEGALRLNIPIIGDRSLFEPFAFVGLGWTRYNVVNSSTTTAAISDNDDVLTVPYGAGLAFGYNGFFADARFTYRSTFYNDLLRRVDGNGAPLDNWSAGAQLGFEF
jgi:hypothetical protein